MATLAQAGLTTTERHALDRAVAALEDRLGGDLQAVWMYGSRARGERPHEDSDIELLTRAQQMQEHREGADYEGRTFERHESAAQVADARRFLKAVERLIGARR